MVDDPADSGDWAILRQLIFGALDNRAAGDTLRAELGVGAGFADPGLEKIDMDDNTIPVGNGCFFEIVSPRDHTTSLGRWLTKAGGSGGYMLAIQHPDVRAVRERADRLGVDEILEDVYQGYELVQLSPWKLGLIIEIDGIPDRNVWYWDHLGLEPEPDAAITDILGIEVTVADPPATAQLWNDLLNLPPCDDPASVQLDTRTIRFVQGDGRPRMTAMTLRRADGSDRSAPERLLGLDVRYA